jgi:predicted flap endonuclease-1-like 5' DNA nuclease
MSIDPALVGTGGVIATIAAAAAYSYLTGDSAGADVDDDGEAEVTFEEGATSVNADLDENEGDDGDEPDITFDADSLTDVKGIGSTRAEKLADAGFEAVSDLYSASDADLTDVNGIGEYTVEQVRDDIGDE